LHFGMSLKRRAGCLRIPWLPRTRSARRSALLGPAALHFVWPLKRRAGCLRIPWLSSHSLGAPLGATRACGPRVLGRAAWLERLSGGFGLATPPSSFAHLMGESRWL